MRGISLKPLKASEWTALAEDKATGLDRFGRASMLTTLAGERWLCATTLRNMLHSRLRKVSSKSSRSFTLTIYGFTARQWEVIGGGMAYAGPRSSTISRVDSNGWASTATGMDVRTSVEENIHMLALDASGADERGAIAAVLGTGLGWARAERHLTGPDIGAAMAFKTGDTVHLIRAAPAAKRRPSFVLRWRENAGTLTLKVNFQVASAGNLNERFALFPGGLV